MHELGITHSLLDIALHHAQKANAVHIKELNLVIGELSNIVDDSIQFYWDMISQGTIAEGAILKFKRIPASLHCDDCEQVFGMNRRDFICPHCGSEKISVVGGSEFFLESIDVDFAPEAQTP